MERYKQTDGQQSVYLRVSIFTEPEEKRKALVNLKRAVLFF